MLKDKFQYILIGFFILAAIIGIAIFASSGKSKSSDELKGTVVMWGTAPASLFSKQFGEYTSDKETYGVTYVQKDKESFVQDVIEALASGKGPDLYLLTSDDMWALRDKIYEFPFESLPERTFRDTYINGASVFLTDSGIVGLPLRVDPVVMYYNRTILDSHFIATPPAYWDDMYSFAQAVTLKTDTGIVTESAVALGAWDNVSNAKDILATLLLQSGSTITKRDGTALTSTLASGAPGSSGIPAQSVLTFYSEFANPVSLYYSWNEAKPNSLDAFISGDLALYFGYASELPVIRSKNPNLDFDVSMVPQVKSTSSKATYGKIYAVAISKFSKNIATAAVVARDVTEKTFVEDILANDYAAPAQRTLLGSKPEDLYKSAFYQSALIAKSWLDPDPEETNKIFRAMVKTYTSGADTAYNAIRDASSNIDNL